MQGPFRWRWRPYRTASGDSPVVRFLADLNPDDRARVARAMQLVRREGFSVARHLRGDIYEVRVISRRTSFRVLFAQESRPVMLALAAFQKTSQKTPRQVIELAEKRLRD